MTDAARHARRAEYLRRLGRVLAGAAAGALDALLAVLPAAVLFVLAGAALVACAYGALWTFVACGGGPDALGPAVAVLVPLAGALMAARTEHATGLESAARVLGAAAAGAVCALALGALVAASMWARTVVVIAGIAVPVAWFAWGRGGQAVDTPKDVE